MNPFFLILILFASVVYLLISDYKKHSGFKKQLILILAVFHFSLTYFFYKFSLESFKDSYRLFINYDRLSLELFFNDFKIKTLSKFFMTSIAFVAKKVGFNYLTLCYYFSFISFLGFREILNKISLEKNKNLAGKLIIYFLIFMPSIHFWTSGFSKEAITFFILILILFTKRLEKKNLIKLIVLLSILFSVRFYIFFIVLYGILCEFFIKSVKTSIINKKKLFYSLIFLLVLTFLLISEIYLGEFLERLNVYSIKNGMTSIPINESNYFERMIMLLFRPLFYDSINIRTFLISFENLFFIVLIFSFLTKSKKNTKNFIISNTYVLIVIISCVVFYSFYMYNMGLANRMKTMFMPYLLYLLILRNEE